MNVAIIKYNAGNTRSVIYALRRLGIDPLLTADPEEIAGADKVIFPGVGEASTTMSHLHELGLDRVIQGLKQPVLGICLGLQLMCRHSEENNTECLGIFEVNVRRFPSAKDLKVPHMGWNTLIPVTEDPILQGIGPESHAYFVHSYYAEISADTLLETEYTLPFSSAMRRDNFYAFQFHPEKSADTGARLLQNFISL